MLKLPVLHPRILAALGSAGHLSKVLISDGHYPHSTAPNPRAEVVWANFTPGVIGAAQALAMVADLVAIEQVAVMAPNPAGEFAMDHEPPIWSEFRQILKTRASFPHEMTKLFKPEFNAQARGEDVALVIATAETQIYGNVLVTIGVVR
jgi:L-fucose mutarotase